VQSTDQGTENRSIWIQLKFVLGSVVKGTISIRHSVTVPDPVIPSQAAYKRPDLMQDLKQRYVPFGLGTSNL